jgi:hypothetical protein
MEGRHVVEAGVGEIQIECVALLELDVGPLVLAHLFLGPRKHIGGGIDADHVNIRRITIERDAGADSHLEDTLIGAQLEIFDHRMLTVDEHAAEDRVVDYR